MYAELVFPGRRMSVFWRCPRPMTLFSDLWQADDFQGEAGAEPEYEQTLQQEARPRRADHP